jgi:hypothetical protein
MTGVLMVELEEGRRGERRLKLRDGSLGEGLC